MNALQATWVPALRQEQSKPRHCTRLGKYAAGMAIASLALAAGAYELPSDGVYSDRIDWGVMMDLSGPASYAQGPWVNGFQDYMRKVNDAGGTHGRKINVLAEDDRFDSSVDRINYEKLVSQTPVLGISGLGNAGAQVALMASIRRGKVPIVGTHTTTKAGTEPPTPLFYGGFCGYREMAQVGVGFFTEMLKLKAPKVAAVHVDTVGGKEYSEYVAEASLQHGGTSKSIPIKVTAADATPQVLELIAMKPDFVTVHGVSNTAILLMRTMQQYGLKIPVFGMTYLGTPVVISALGPEAGGNYYFVSCFTPGGVDESGGVKEMAAFADKYGHSALKEDINYVAGWVIGQVVAESIARVGPEPTREKLVESMNKGFEVDTKGLSSQLKYTRDDHLGLVVLRPYSYDYAAKKFKAYGKYSDYQKYVK
jgi:branched-chain amino acid transport system substrate-binding protein